MRCKTVQKMIPLYEAGILDSLQNREIEAHFAECDACREQFEELLYSHVVETDQSALCGFKSEQFRACFSGETLTDYVEGQLSAADAVIVEEHMSSCQYCRSAVEALSEHESWVSRFFSELQNRLFAKTPLRLILALQTAVVVFVITGIITNSGALHTIQFPEISYPAPFQLKGDSKLNHELEIVKNWHDEQWDVVERLLITLALSEPEIHSLNLFLGITFIRNNNPNVAIKYLLKGIDTAPSGSLLAARYYLALAEAYTDIEDCEAARDALEKAVVINPALKATIDPLISSLTTRGCGNSK